MDPIYIVCSTKSHIIEGNNILHGQLHGKLAHTIENNHLVMAIIFPSPREAYMHLFTSILLVIYVHTMKGISLINYKRSQIKSNLVKYIIRQEYIKYWTCGFYLSQSGRKALY